MIFSERNKLKNLEVLNRIFDLLGPHGGSIAVENDWTFYCRVNDLGDGDHEADLYSMSDEDEGAFVLLPDDALEGQHLRPRHHA